MLRVARRTAVAAGEHLAAGGNAGDHRVDRVRNRLGKDLCSSVLQICAVEELLLDTLFKHKS
jgi:hypothetical protein